MENQPMPKQYIEFKCQHQRIERTDDFFVVGGSQKYLYAKFDLCSDWSGLQQYAVFTGGLKTFRIPIVDGECEVPWEMLLEKRFFVGCEAGQRITSNAAEVKVNPCGAPEETGTPRKPTPTLQSQIGNLDDLKTEAKGNLVDAINEVCEKRSGGGSTPGEPGADGEDGGYYIPNVSQVDENTMSVSFAASKEGMADVADQEITLPSGKNGADGKPGADGKNGSDGYTPYIGANGNWFIGETDTGMPSRGEDAPQEAILYTPQDLTHEQQAQARQNIGAIEAPETAEAGQTIVVKEVDENSKPTAWEAADFPANTFFFTLTLEEEVASVSLSMPVAWERILRFNVHCTLPTGVGGEPTLQMYLGGGYMSYGGIPSFKGDSIGFNQNGTRFLSESDNIVFAVGSISSTVNDVARPAAENGSVRAGKTSKTLRYYLKDPGDLVFPKGTLFEVWGVTL